MSVHDERLSPEDRRRGSMPHERIMPRSDAVAVPRRADLVTVTFRGSMRELPLSPGPRTFSVDRPAG
jgi:hypothetical protein